jgi:hypothetical protein
MPLYHVTLAENLSSILCDGLRPNIGPRSRASGEPRAAVYFFRDRAGVENGLLNWLGQWFTDHHGEEAPLAIIQIEGVAESHSSPGAYELLSTEWVPPGAISAIFDESWRPLQHHLLALSNRAEHGSILTHTEPPP